MYGSRSVFFACSENAIVCFVLRDGASRCGLIRAIADVISRMTSEGQVDVYTGVKHVQNVRPESVSSVVGSVPV